jgi:hypothetical protein
MWVTILCRLNRETGKKEYLQPPGVGMRFAARETAARFPVTSGPDYDAAREEMLAAVTPNPGIEPLFAWYPEDYEVPDQ